jgi:hypothetical protein
MRVIGLLSFVGVTTLLHCGSDTPATKSDSPDAQPVDGSAAADGATALDGALLTDASALDCKASTNWENPSSGENTLMATDAKNETFSGSIACTLGACRCDGSKSCGDDVPYLVRTHSLDGIRRFDWRFEVKVVATELVVGSTFVTPKGLNTVLGQWAGANASNYQVRGNPEGVVSFFGATPFGALTVGSLSDFTTVRITAARATASADWQVEDVTFQNGGPATSVKGAQPVIAQNGSFLQLGPTLRRSDNCKNGGCKYEAIYGYRNVALTICK